MSIFDKRIILYEGKNKLIYQDCQKILRDHKIGFKAYAIEDQLRGGCCNLNNESGLRRSGFTYTIFVKAKEADAAKEWVRQAIGYTRMPQSGS